VVAQETGTHRSERLPARGSTSEDDVRIVVLVHAEEALQCRFVTDAAREFESAIVLVGGSVTSSSDVGHTYNCCIRNGLTCFLRVMRDSR
jgi:hypothetical protein